VWLHGEVKSPPLTAAAGIEAGLLLRPLQGGERLELPHSRPMPGMAPRCHERRIPDETVTWRIVYRVDSDAVVIVDVFAKKTQKTPGPVVEACRRRLRVYDSISDR